MTDPAAKQLKRIDETTLISLAGKTCFDRGETYYLQDRVGDLRRQDNGVIAIVEGNEKYRVSLIHTAKVFEGSCDCPASEGFDFCKHCVAAALKYIEQLAEQEKLQASSEADLLENYLYSLKQDKLARELLKLIEYDPELEHEWTLRAQLAAGKMNFKSFKKRITQSIPYNRDLYRYDQVRRFFTRVETLVDTLSQLLAGIDHAQALQLIDYALLRIHRALQTIDDSGGFRYYSVDTLGEMHVQTLAECGWPAGKIADYLRKLYTSDAVELYPEIPDEYLSILDATGLELFNAPLAAEWETLPELQADEHGNCNWDAQYRYLRLQAPLLAAARLEQDLDSEIALLAKTAALPHHMIEISHFCLEHERIDQAIDWWQKARKAGAENTRHAAKSALLELEVEILVYQKKYPRALEIRWSDFQRYPSMPTYQKLLEMAQLAGDERDFYQQAVAWLDAKSGDGRQHIYNLLSEIHLQENNPEAALKLALQHPLSQSTLLTVIRANPQQAELILPLYLQLAESHIRQTKNRAYRDAIKLLGEANEVAGEALREKLTRQIARLRLQYKAKRNFRQWLDQAFPDLAPVDNPTEQPVLPMQ